MPDRSFHSRSLDNASDIDLGHWERTSNQTQIRRIERSSQGTKDEGNIYKLRDLESQEALDSDLDNMRYAAKFPLVPESVSTSSSTRTSPLESAASSTTTGLHTSLSEQIETAVENGWIEFQDETLDCTAQETRLSLFSDPITGIRCHTGNANAQEACSYKVTNSGDSNSNGSSNSSCKRARVDLEDGGDDMGRLRHGKKGKSPVTDNGRKISCPYAKRHRDRQEYKNCHESGGFESLSLVKYELFTLCALGELALI